MRKIDFRFLANNHVRDLVPYQQSRPADELERELGITASIKLASNENPRGPSRKAIEAAQFALQKSHVYPDSGSYALKQALSTFLSVQPAQITIGNGSENILELIVKAYLRPGDTAVISEYAFLTIPILIQSYGTQANIVPAQNWGHDIDGMIKAIDEKTRVIFLVNPNNPTGTYINKKSFKILLESIPQHVVIVIDEAYSEYITDPDYPDALTYLADYPNLIIVRTFSKAYGLAALRLGYSLSSIEIADILNRSRLPFNANAIATAAACAALSDQDHVQTSIALNQQGMQQISDGLRKLNLEFIPSIGNFITINVNDADKIYLQLLREGIIVRPLQAYGMKNHIRVTIGTAEQNSLFLLAMKKIFA